jgi:3-dehydroquinate synthetase
MLHDKKNRRPGEINFTLLLAPGKVVIDETASKEEIKIAFDIFRDMLGI